MRNSQFVLEEAPNLGVALLEQEIGSCPLRAHTRVSIPRSVELVTPHYLTGWPYQAAERLNCAIELRGDTGRSHEMKIWVEMLIHTPEHLLITW